ncbi:MAG TPA: hypothetical protein VMV32_11140 [Ignavibacteriaceae bacterium]|nr:hypothetical protein [Ignavibacteriaceae bacterium]
MAFIFSVSLSTTLEPFVLRAAAVNEAIKSKGNKAMRFFIILITSPKNVFYDLIS